jgi:hypothetical protein
MAFSHGSNAAIHVNGYDLTAYFSSFESQGSTDIAETTVFQQTAKTYIVGLSDGQLSGEGFFDPTAGATGDVLDRALSNRSENVTCYWPNTDTLGNTGVGLSGQETAYNVKSDVGDANKVTAEFQSNVGREGITSHRALASSTASGTATVVDNTVGSPGHPVGYLQVTSCTGGTVTVKIQHSADNSSYSDLLTFTNITTVNAPFAERIEASGTVHRYTRAVTTHNGGTATFGVSLGRYGN